MLTGNRRYISEFPAAKAAYFAWLSICTDDFSIPSNFAILACWSWEECPSSTPSQNVACERSFTFFIWHSFGLSIVWFLRGAWYALSPLIPNRRVPRADDGSLNAIGKFGHARTPSFTCPPMISARQIAYWPPRRNPLVPSIGSSVQKPNQWTKCQVLTYVPKVRLKNCLCQWDLSFPRLWW